MQSARRDIRQARVGVDAVEIYRAARRLVELDADASKHSASNRAVLQFKGTRARQGSRPIDQAAVLQRDGANRVRFAIHVERTTVDGYVAATADGVIYTDSEHTTRDVGQAGVGVDVVQPNRADRGFVKLDSRSRQDRVHRAVLHLEGSGARERSGAVDQATILQRYRADRVLVAVHLQGCIVHHDVAAAVDRVVDPKVQRASRDVRQPSVGVDVVQINRAARGLVKLDSRAGENGVYRAVLHLEGAAAGQSGIAAAINRAAMIQRNRADGIAVI